MTPLIVSSLQQTQIYQKGLKEFPKDESLLSDYVGFLFRIGKYKKAEEYYKKVITIKPDYYKALYNWGTDLRRLAETKQGTQKEELYQKALEKFEKAIKYGANSYNFSCIYA